MATGKPAIQTPNAMDLRTIGGAISNIRQRIEQLEGVQGTTATPASSATATAISGLRTTLTALQQQVDAMSTYTNLIKSLLLQPNGLVVLADGALVTRILEAGAGIEIAFPDGHDANPLIGLTGGTAFLTDEFDNPITLDDGEHIFV